MYGQLNEDAKKLLKSRLDWSLVYCPRKRNAATHLLYKFNFNANPEMV